MNMHRDEVLELKKGDFIWILILAGIFAFLFAPETNKLFNAATAAHPYCMGFVKFAVLATMGDLLAIRLVEKKWMRPAGFIYRVLVWGMIGAVNTLALFSFSVAANAAVEKGMLPGAGLPILVAFFASIMANCMFAPVMMSVHRLSDTYLDLLYKNEKSKPDFNEVVDTIDWKTFFSFVIGKTIPFFWIPAHTITFLLPANYRVFFAALLGIVLGLILSYSRRKTQIKSPTILNCNEQVRS